MGAIVRLKKNAKRNRRSVNAKAAKGRKASLGSAGSSAAPAATATRPGRRAENGVKRASVAGNAPKRKLRKRSSARSNAPRSSLRRPYPPRNPTRIIRGSRVAAVEVAARAAAGVRPPPREGRESCRPPIATDPDQSRRVVPSLSLAAAHGPAPGRAAPDPRADPSLNLVPGQRADLVRKAVRDRRAPPGRRVDPDPRVAPDLRVDPDPRVDPDLRVDPDPGVAPDLRVVLGLRVPLDHDPGQRANLDPVLVRRAVPGADPGHERRARGLAPGQGRDPGQGTRDPTRPSQGSPYRLAMTKISLLCKYTLTILTTLLNVTSWMVWQPQGKSYLIISSSKNCCVRIV